MFSKRLFYLKLKYLQTSLRFPNVKCTIHLELQIAIRRPTGLFQAYEYPKIRK